MSAVSDPYPELHALVDRLSPDRTDQARQTLLHLVDDTPPRARLRALPAFDGPEDLSERVDAYLYTGHRPSVDR